MIEVEDRGQVAIVRMVRGKGNALNLDLALAMGQALEQIEQGPARAMVITGVGSVFGAGVDLAELVGGGATYVRRFLPEMGRVFERLATFPKPVVAAINGHAIAGGAIIMMACDQRILARGTARIGLSEILVGVEFPAWALEVARFAIPAQHFPTLVLTGRTYGAEEALARGLVDELVEADQVLDRACQVADELGALDSQTFTATKMAVRRELVEKARAQSALTDAKMLEAWCSPAALARVGAFVERTFKRKS